MTNIPPTRTLELQLVPGLDFADLKEARDPVTMDYSVDLDVLQRFARGNGLDWGEIVSREENVDAVVRGWYQLHLRSGGKPSSLRTAMALEGEMINRVSRPEAVPALAARAAVKAMEEMIPGVWQKVDMLRSGHSDAAKLGLPWPDYSFVPGYIMSHAFQPALLRVGVEPQHTLNQLTALTLLAGWRVTQGVYQFDPDVYEALVRTPMDRDIPHEVLMRLPAWSVFIETPGIDIGTIGPNPLRGAFVGLDPAAPEQGRPHPHLLISFLADETFDSVAIALGPWSLEQCIERAVRSLDPTYQLTSSDKARVTALVSPVLALTLYLCTEKPDVGERKYPPPRPQPVKTRRGLRHFPPQQVQHWSVAMRLGAALRRARDLQRQERPDGLVGTHLPMAAHVRSAHWHGFWTGPMTGPRKFILKWLPPIPVNVWDYDDLPAVVHPVHGE